MTIRYTQSNEPFKQRKLSGMRFSRSATATSKREAQHEADKMHGLIYELYTR